MPSSRPAGAWRPCPGPCHGGGHAGQPCRLARCSGRWWTIAGPARRPGAAPGRRGQQCAQPAAACRAHLQAHLGTKNCTSAMERYVYRRRNDGIFVFNLGKTWEKLQLAARIIVAIENPQDIVAISARPYGQRAVLKFANYTGAKATVGRHTPGEYARTGRRLPGPPCRRCSAWSSAADRPLLRWCCLQCCVGACRSQAVLAGRPSSSMPKRSSSS